MVFTSSSCSYFRVLNYIPVPNYVQLFKTEASNLFYTLIELGIALKILQLTGLAAVSS